MTFFVPFGNRASRTRTVLVTGATGMAGYAQRPQCGRPRPVVPAHRRTRPGNPTSGPGDATRRGPGPAPDRHQAPEPAMRPAARAVAGRAR